MRYLYATLAKRLFFTNWWVLCGMKTRWRGFGVDCVQSELSPRVSFRRVSEELVLKLEQIKRPNAFKEENVWCFWVDVVVIIVRRKMESGLVNSVAVVCEVQQCVQLDDDIRLLQAIKLLLFPPSDYSCTGLGAHNAWKVIYFFFVCLSVCVW